MEGDDEQPQGLAELQLSQPAEGATDPPSRGANRIVEFLRSSKHRGRLLGLLLVAATFIAYLPMWRAGFIWDDDTMLTGNHFVQAADGLRWIWFSTKLFDYFPATFTTLWLEWRLWGAHPLGYHLVNVCLHALSAVLWWRVLTRLKTPGAWLAAAVFALHPVNVESVAWITQRKNTLAMVFFVLTLLWHLRFEDTGRRRWYGTALGAFALALLSKTAVAPLPLVLLGLAWWRRGRVERRDVWRSVPFFAIAAGLALVTVWFQYHKAIGPGIVRTDSFWSRLAGAGWAVWFYLYKAVLPLNLVFVYPRWWIDAANVLSYVPGLLVVAGLLLCWRYRRRGGRAGLLGMGYYVVMLLPILGFLNIAFMRYSLVADHYQYFSIISPIALATAGITTVLGSYGKTRTLLKAAFGGMLLMALGILAWRQCAMYAGIETLWLTTIARNPRCVIAHNDLGVALLQQKRTDEAIAHFEEVLEIQPQDATARLNLGSALLQKGRVDEAVAFFEKVLEGQPEDGITSATAHKNLGWVCLQNGQVAEAVRHLQKALETQPDDATAHNALGKILLQQGRVDEAMSHFRKALEIRPDFVSAHTNLAGAFLRKGQAREALAQSQTALKLQPDNPQILSDMAWVLATGPEASVRNGAQAIELAQRANQLSGGQDPLILRTLAAAYAESGRFAEAITTAQQALRLAVSQSNAVQAGMLRSELKLYHAGSPLRDPGPTNGAANPNHP